MSSVSEQTAKRKREFFDRLYNLDEGEENEECQQPQKELLTLEDPSKPNGVDSNRQQFTHLKNSRRNPQRPTAKESARKVFHGLHFYFIPNDDKNTARRLRIKKAEQYGASWARTWNSCVTHIIVDKDVTHAQVLKHLQLLSIPAGAALVKEDYPADCIRDGMILNPQHPRYQVKGFQNPQMGRRPTYDSGDQSNTQTLRSLAPKNKEAGDQSRTMHPSGQFRESISNRPLKDSGALEDAIVEARAMSSIPLDLEDDDCASITTSAESDGEIERKRPKKPRNTVESVRDQGFKCMHPGGKSSASTNPNQRTISILQQMCDYYIRTNDHWRSLAYRRSILALKKQPQKITSAASASQIPGIGSHLASKIEEIVHTDRLQRLESTNLDENDRLQQLFTGIYQVGFAQANSLIAKGHRTLSDLADSNDLSTNQRIGLEHYTDFQRRIPRAEVEALADIVGATLAAADSDLQVIIGGSYRRGAADSGDIDLIITKEGGSISDIRISVVETVIPRLESAGFIKASFTNTQSSKWHGACALPSNGVWRRIDLLFVPSSELGAALIYFTGNDIFNRSIRLLASKKGMRLNQHGLFDNVIIGTGRERTTEGRLVEGQDEKKIFEVLGVPWRRPEERIC